MELLLIRRAQKGDTDAFVTLIERNKKSLYKIAKSYLKNEEDIADVIQDTILSAYEHIKELRKTAYFRTWITRILINHCNDLRKQQKRFRLVLDCTALRGNASDFSSILWRRVSGKRNRAHFRHQ